MPNILLSEAYDLKLKQLVVDPFEETRESIIKDLIDAEIVRRNVIIPKSDAADEKIHLSATMPGSLSHTKVVSATIDGKELNRPKWNGVRDRLHILAFNKLGSFDAVRKISDANLKSGKYEDDGYKYLPEINFSIQGVDANLAWTHSLKLARELNIPIRLRIAWRENEKAAHPGKMGLIEWAGENKSL